MSNSWGNDEWGNDADNASGRNNFDNDDGDVTRGRSFGGKGRGYQPRDGTKPDFGDHASRRGRGGRGGRCDFQNGNRGDSDRSSYGRNNRDWKSNENGNDRSGNGWDNGSSESRGFGDSNRGPRSFEKENGNDCGDEENKPKPVTYIPKELGEEDLMADLGISKGINFDDYEHIEVKCTGIDVPRKIERFEEANFRDILVESVRRHKYDKPTPIQKYSIPVIMAGRDLMATAQTGSGKTAAYLLPIIQKLLQENAEAHDGSAGLPGAVIMAPTRELAIQIHEVARKFACGSFLKVQIVYGGVSVRHQIYQLQKGCHILIATVGRLKDFVGKRHISFNNIKFIVLDEADRMLDMGFRLDIEEIMKNESMPPEKQILMFSATFDNSVRDVAKKFLVDYVFITVGLVGGACKDVEQNFLEVQFKEKKKTLVEILERDRANSSVEGTLLFVEKKRTADVIASYLSEIGMRTTSVHGDRLQEQREEALHDFKTGKMSILVATNVAARGLDISGVHHVINYDLPNEIDEYVHRIGRTGRLGNKGKATSFFDSTEDRDNRLAPDLVRVLKQANQKIPQFLAEKAGDCGDYEGTKFGGFDCRENSNTDSRSYSQPSKNESNENWDDC